MCETPSWRFEPRTLSPTPHKHVYLYEIWNVIFYTEKERKRVCFEWLMEMRVFAKEATVIVRKQCWGKPLKKMNNNNNFIIFRVSTSNLNFRIHEWCPIRAQLLSGFVPYISHILSNFPCQISNVYMRWVPEKCSSYFSSYLFG